MAEQKQKRCLNCKYRGKEYSFAYYRCLRKKQMTVVSVHYVCRQWEEEDNG